MKGDSIQDKFHIIHEFMMDLSEAFNCLTHEPQLAKLHAYGFGRSAHAFIHSYLSNRRQWSKLIVPLVREKKLTYVYRKIPC